MRDTDDETGSETRNVRVCSDCKVESPEVETNYTLISARHGWRLARTVDAEGKLLMQWRCPRCWTRHKSLKTT
ncbi:MAG TPA: hypothetical protein VGK73_05490 [Polyangiaceae bacterium]